MHGPMRFTFQNRRYIVIDSDACIGCHLCIKTCPLKTVLAEDETTGKAVVINQKNCAGCYKCVEKCPPKAISTISLHPWATTPIDQPSQE